ncbi:MAG: MATE family efflux transporter, partial [Deltaproteobacteria bacterium]|nr:MATE family efflux transporter [Deltaproteobacteria bacterium]
MAERDLTTGSVPGLMIRLALPVLGGFILQSAYALVDLYWVGRLGSASVAGVGIVLNTFFIVLALGMIVGVGALALLSRAYGAGNREGIPALFQQVFWLSWGIGAAACLGALATAATFMEIFTNDPLVYSEGLAYFRIYAFSFLLQPVLMSLGFCWRAIGDFFTPPLLMGISVATNMALDPLLIFGWGPFPELGIRGASLATVISQIIPLAVYLWLVLGRVRNTLLVLNRPLKLDFGIIRRILRIGLPSGLQFVVVSLSLMLMFRGVKSFGGEAAAAMGIG